MPTVSIATCLFFFCNKYRFTTLCAKYIYHIVSQFLKYLY